MKRYYLLGCVLLAVSGCGTTTHTAQANAATQIAAGTDYSYIYTQMANEGSCRNNMTLGGGLSAKCQ